MGITSSLSLCFVSYECRARGLAIAKIIPHTQEGMPEVVKRDVPHLYCGTHADPGLSEIPPSSQYEVVLSRCLPQEFHQLRAEVDDLHPDLVIGLVFEEADDAFVEVHAPF